MRNNATRIFVISIVSVLLLATSFIASAIAANAQNTNEVNRPQQSVSYTHTVLAEEASGTWCQCCPTVMQQMHQLYNSGQYDFYYVSLVQDKNSYASWRCLEYNIYGYPTVYYDGGYKVVLGAGDINTEIAALNVAGARVVPNVDLSLKVSWLGNAQIGVVLNVTNNEASTYTGHIHAYITEINSRWWNNISGHNQYHFAMIGNYALNQNVNVPAGSTSSYTSTWNGNTYGMGNIDQNNIMVVATVFNSASHQGYSNPPSGNPFTAYWADDTTAVKITMSADAGGPYQAEVGQAISFTGTASDGSPPYTWSWDFGDGNTSSEQNPVYSYHQVGVFTVNLTVTDNQNNKVYDTTTATITQPSQPILEISQIKGGFGVSAILKNNGTAAATNVQWKITILGRVTNGTIPSIAPGGQVSVKSKLVFGFGKTPITVEADYAEGSPIIKSVNGFVFLILVLGLK